ncbi:hypothetical protein [Caulobacter sp. FWC2]|uniref:hypothetical protein n=1 Tax=Caulobacter sp. FWC2 TaxID=69664 RepID=UPI000C15C04F|nr:hypothetical protein [Caulobacter sp. FWC2]PIB91257.1 hypothetical protein CSW62_06520 [Caulobacter sp. FWC2]
MTDFKGTPGPWFVEGSGVNALVRTHDDFAIVAKRHRLPGDVHEANARLIALAPEMRDALEALLTEAEDVFVCMADATGIDRHNLPGPFRVARVVLSRAAGADQ